ncbi:glycoside hydrolase family 43 protein [Aplosporella prunicola CBS 121167]|uniref:Glycoside hydrolase family 43 protein n=1 Tax=Aplosporella prunicola CBS 121167 TaxID=1176127 RepID=A0A6A6BF03_9PEZI|nr:glycoside hydrolase family 43 protein [Aplosporella prunicola CBS 121167]KAF2142148.1 glycoside hydrolase family 43 protein [Aplosporella prunicola CBS 121167]
MFLSALFLLCEAALAHPPQSLDFSGASVSRRADSSLVGYLGVFFLGADPDVYFYLSEGNDPLAFSALNGGEPVIEPTLGTKGVRDPAVVAGGGDEAGRKWYIVGTDLDISKTTWDAAQRTGSRGIFVWESSDLVNWSEERLVEVEDSTAGMVWAPEAIWDSDKGQYLVHWASAFYASTDSAHSSTASAIKIRYAHTSDFRAFSAPQTYIDNAPASTIDLTFLPLGTNAYARFLKNETAKTVYQEVSADGLFGTWTRPGGPDAVIQTQVEGPAVYWDNEVEGKAHLLLDYYGGDGYAPFESKDVKGAAWAASQGADAFPPGLRHGAVLGVNQTIFDALRQTYG